jgi:signal transduction histidine kinase
MARTSAELGLAGALEAREPVIEAAFPGAVGRWEVRRKAFRQAGERHQLLVLTDLSRTLREEERQAWQRLIRVMGHELNNSLTPISSIAGSLEQLVSREPLPPDWEDDMRRGLSVIASRSGALTRFLAGYSLLARLPTPRLAPVRVEEVVRPAAALETRMPVLVSGGAEVTVHVDADQIQQLLINLLRNAVDASSETGGAVSIGWNARKSGLEIWVEDEGPGLPDPANLFVPYFTTKPQGSGIGLVLCRQIAEAHGGTVRLSNRSGGPGCRASVLLPLRRRAGAL